ncbi:MAG: hypothetical protein MJ051_00825 [Akkermansia sp.]|nr:hypothetical protein [Akkermansia sp.]
MKNNKLFALLLCAAVFVAVPEAFAATYTAQDAVALASNVNASVDSVCKAVGDAVQDAAVSPSKLFSDVMGARKSWTSAQVAGVYKSILIGSPELSASFVDDLDAFQQAGNPTTVSSDASEGMKLLAALYGMQISGVNADAVLASVVSSSMGGASVMSVAPLRDVSARAASSRRTHPSAPTPPATSSEN